jgi:hypothetical protein
MRGSSTSQQLVTESFSAITTGEMRRANHALATDDIALLAAAAGGDERAFEVFYRRYVPAEIGPTRASTPRHHTS